MTKFSGIFPRNVLSSSWHKLSRPRPWPWRDVPYSGWNNTMGRIFGKIELVWTRWIQISSFVPPPCYGGKFKFFLVLFLAKHGPNFWAFLISIFSHKYLLQGRLWWPFFSPFGFKVVWNIRLDLDIFWTSRVVRTKRVKYLWVIRRNRGIWTNWCLDSQMLGQADFQNAQNR